jgi:hypothetical protein
MRITDEKTGLEPIEDRGPEAAVAYPADDPHAPHKLTFRENVILTVKVLAIAGLLIAALWGISLWNAAS